MVLLPFALLCGAAVSVVAGPIEDALLNGQSLFNETTLQSYLENFSKLNELYQELYQAVNNTFTPKSQQPKTFSRMVKQAQENPDTMKPVNGRPDQIPYLFEGDIILTESQLQQQIKNAETELARRKNETMRFVRSMTSDLSLRWRVFPIQYYITPGVPVSAVQAGIQRWQQLTCITFQQVTQQPRGNGLIFIRGNGCYSYIGMVAQGAQQVSIGVGCEALGTVMHEIGHALGFYHEQSRSDRDSYVRIVTQNIQNIYIPQFSKQAPSTMVDYGVTYDYGSVMHYDQFAFSQNGGMTIQTYDANYQLTIGQRNEAGFADVKKINFAYCNASCTTQLPCQNGGYTDPLACSQCRCPTGLGGQYCDQPATSYSGCPQGQLTATSSLQQITASGALVCNFLITAPPGKKVYFQVTSLSFPYQQVCSTTYLELKYGANLGNTGARLCGRTYPGGATTQTSQLLVIFQGYSSARFTLSYRYDPVSGEQTDASTTVAPTAPIALCAGWGACSQPCGACGTQTRACSTGFQTQPCNAKPCPGNICCPPASFDGTQGLCVVPDEADEQPQNKSTRPPTIVTAATAKPIPVVPAVQKPKKPLPKKAIQKRKDQPEVEGSGEEPTTTTVASKVEKKKGKGEQAQPKKLKPKAHDETEVEGSGEEPTTTTAASKVEKKKGKGKKAEPKKLKPKAHDDIEAEGSGEEPTTEEPKKEKKQKKIGKNGKNKGKWPHRHQQDSDSAGDEE